jgi:peptidoglycan/LPS O-acetylase OafA/YrhL
MGIIRIILAISVVLAHTSSIYGLGFVDAGIAVQAFYIISGFYMALILNEKYIGKNNSYKLFITNRFLRLYPIYWTVLLLIILSSFGVIFITHGAKLGHFTIYNTYIHQMSFGSLAFLIFTNIALFFQDIVMFLGFNTSTGNLFFTSNFTHTSPYLNSFLFVPQAWTIGIELTFYLIAPFLARKKMKYILLILASSIALRIFLAFIGLKEDPWNNRFFPLELTYFLLGIIAYKMYVKLKNANLNLMIHKSAFGLVLGCSFVYNYLSFPIQQYIYLFVFFACLPFIFLLSKKWKIDAYIGELSYPIYIGHTFVFYCIKPLSIVHKVGVGLSVTLGSILFAILLNELVAKKIEKIRQGRLSLMAVKS